MTRESSAWSGAMIGNGKSKGYCCESSHRIGRMVFQRTKKSEVWDESEGAIGTFHRYHIIPSEIACGSAGNRSSLVSIPSTSIVLGARLCGAVAGGGTLGASGVLLAELSLGVPVG